MSPEGEGGDRLLKLFQRITAQVTTKGVNFVRTTPRMRLGWDELNGLSEEEEDRLLCQLEYQGLLVVKKSGGVYNFSPKTKKRK